MWSLHRAAIQFGTAPRIGKLLCVYPVMRSRIQAAERFTLSTRS